MAKILHILHVFKGVLFRGTIFFRFELIGYLNFYAALKPKQPAVKRIAFQAYNPQIAQVFKPVISKLQTIKGVELYFIIMFHPYHGFKGIKDTKQFAMDELGIPEDRIYKIWNVYWKKFDALICSDVYAKFPVSKTRKILLPHGAGMLSRWIQKSYLRKTAADFDTYVLCGDLDFRQVKDFIGKKTELSVTGFPFVESLTRNSQNEVSDMKKRLDCDTSKKIVMYAPSWGHTYNYGDILSRNFEAVMDCLLAKDVIILVKLHAASFIKGQSRGVCWKEKVEKYRQSPNVRIIDDLNDIPFLKTADILISDISSRSFNFMLLSRPVILYGVPDAFTHTGTEKIRLEKMLEAAFLANTPEALSKTLDKCLQTPEAYTVASKQVAKDVFANPDCATFETVKKILEPLDIVL